MEEINLTITPLSFDEFKAKYQEQYSSLQRFDPRRVVQGEYSCLNLSFH